MTKQEFMKSLPIELPAFYKAYKQIRKIIDEEMWLMGQYIMSALDATVCNNSLWKGKNGTPSKYFEKPILSQHEEKKNKELTEEEKQKQVDLFFAREKARRVNWKRNQKTKDSTVS